MGCTLKRQMCWTMRLVLAALCLHWTRAAEGFSSSNPLYPKQSNNNHNKPFAAAVASRRHNLKNRGGGGGAVTNERTPQRSPVALKALSSSHSFPYHHRISTTNNNNETTISSSSSMMNRWRDRTSGGGAASSTTDLDATTTTSKQQEQQLVRRLPWIVGAIYFLAALCATIPIALLPTMAADLAPTAALAASLGASVAACGTLGGGLGKLVNGLVCQGLGARRSLVGYLTGMAVVSFGLGSPLVASSSSSSQSVPVLLGLVALLEFFWSIMWTGCSVVLVQHLSPSSNNDDNNNNKSGIRSDKRLAEAVTTLGFMSTVGTLTAKVGGAALLGSRGDWKSVVRLGGVAALMGAAVAQWGTPRDDEEETKGVSSSSTSNSRPSVATTTSSSEASSSTSLWDSFRRVLSNRIFWVVGLAHAAAFLARTCDRVLGSFYLHVSAGALPKHVCGGLTTSCTLGFVHGLAVRSKHYHELETPDEKVQFLKHCYAQAAWAAAGLALCGAPGWISQIIPSGQVRALLVAVLSGVMTSCLSFPFYQIPNLFAVTEFAPNKAIFLSLKDGIGYFFSTAVWAATGRMVKGGGGASNAAAGVASGGVGYAWSATWLMLLLLYVGGGKLMVQAMEKRIFNKETEDRE